ncbi:dihydrofolate synthetase-like isoform X1 [Arachis ipaensis]|uniref:dihydrofolate synthetase-like isoform X1 n=2 Tax=Arachis ipaensis TaxID=130454 RepID=UPI000A2AFE63|nr:dihydrofolate synthetase-like isoform X1 [Arachis ipaensis]XP_020971398.1 dihydrofolate synthetase-like isoform X1 [Arachis ipaensis]
MAFILFAEENVDIAVVEAGLGGARDAKNVISSVRIKAAPHTPLRLRDDPETGSILEKLTEENLRDWGLLQDFYRFVKTIESSAKEFFGQRWNSCNSRNS